VNPTCSQNGKITEISPKVYVATPGYYGSVFPNAPGPAGKLTLEQGIYCLGNGINLQSTWNITTDRNDNGVHDSNTEGVFFYVPNGDVTFNGSSNIRIHAVSAPYAGFDSKYLNYLIYLPATNNSTVKITGGDGSSFTGTILAPAAHITLSGGSTTSGGTDTGTVILDAQIISYTMEIAGNGTLDIIYDQADNGVTTTPATLSQNQ